jgi:hypothetical protein
MQAKTSYDSAVTRSVLTILAGAALAIMGGTTAVAQIRGLPPTATSLGPGGQVVAPLPPTATSVGPGALGNSGFGGRIGVPGFGMDGRGRVGHHHHHINGGTFIGGAYPVYVPVPVTELPYADDGTDGGPDGQPERPAATVFERGYRADAARYPRTMDDADDYPSRPAHPADAQPAGETSPAASDASKPVAAQTPSVLVFKDGHKLEVQNYAIVGDTLYDFSPGHQRKIALSQLDLKATSDANESAGVEFQLPGRAQ